MGKKHTQTVHIRNNFESIFLFCFPYSMLSNNQCEYHSLFSKFCNSEFVHDRCKKNLSRPTPKTSKDIIREARVLLK